MKWITVAFAAFLLLVIGMANTGTLSPYVVWLHEVPAGDKVGHFILMGLLSFLVNFSLRARRWRLGPFEVLAGSVIVIAIVSAEEFLQSFIPRRNASWGDLAADYLGILIMGWIAAGIVARTATKPQLATSCASGADPRGEAGV